MKFLLIIVGFLFSSCAAATCPEVYMYFIGSNLSDLKKTTNNTNFNLLGSSYFDKMLPTVFYTGGWLSNILSFDAQVIFDAYITTRRNTHNLVYIDWYEYNKDLYFIPMIQNVECAAKQAAKIIGKLRTDTWVDPSSFHFIGFNFGAHFMAYVARNMLLPPVKRITGLDPGAALGFTEMIFMRYNFKVLYWTDADMVDIIHTSAGKFGYDRDFGHVDFYVNGGTTQPGCSLIDSVKEFKRDPNLNNIYLLFCNHVRSVELYAESVRRTSTPTLPFLSARCGLVYTYNPSTCSYTADNVSMGFYAKNPAGVMFQYSKRFYVETTDNSAQYSLT